MAVKISKQLKAQGVTVRAGEGAWAQWGGEYGDVVIAFCRSDARPGLDWSPLYPASRVTGDSYQPYHSRTEWAEAANASMSADANSNFRRQSSY
jgi:hypothetical protein